MHRSLRLKSKQVGHAYFKSPFFHEEICFVYYLYRALGYFAIL